MDIIKKYGDVIRQKTETDPQKALRMFRFGFGVEYQKASKLADKQLPYGYREIYKAAVKNTREVLEEPQKSVWTNIFGPVEIFQCFGLNPTSLEMLAGFMSGFRTEDYFIDRAESIGIALFVSQTFSRYGGIRRHAFSGFYRSDFCGLRRKYQYDALCGAQARNEIFCRGCTSRGFRGSGALCRVSAV